MAVTGASPRLWDGDSPASQIRWNLLPLMPGSARRRRFLHAVFRRRFSRVSGGAVTRFRRPLPARFSAPKVRPLFGSAGPRPEPIYGGHFSSVRRPIFAPRRVRFSPRRQGRPTVFPAGVAGRDSWWREGYRTPRNEARPMGIYAVACSHAARWRVGMSSGWNACRPSAAPSDSMPRILSIVATITSRNCESQQDVYWPPMPARAYALAAPLEAAPLEGAAARTFAKAASASSPSRNTPIRRKR